MLAAYRLMAVGTLDDIRAALPRFSGRPKRFLRAVAAQYAGRVDDAVHMLRAELSTARDFDRVAVYDVLAPILVMRQQFDDVAAIGRELVAARQTAIGEVFLAIADACRRNRSHARKHFRKALAAVERVDDDVVRCRVLQRLALASFYLNDFHRALDLASRCSQLACVRGAWRLAASAYSIGYAVHHAGTGNLAEADAFAQLWHAAACKSRDQSALQAAIVAGYEIAVQLADEARMATLEAELRRRVLPEQYAEGFAYAYSQAVRIGKSDLAGMRRHLRMLAYPVAHARAERSLCTGLMAVASAGLYDDDIAREQIREAISSLGRPSKLEPAYEGAYRRLARVAIASACLLLGDNVRASRVLSVREIDGASNTEMLRAVLQTGRHERLPHAQRGVADVFHHATRERLSGTIPAGITRAEFAVLRLLADGWTASKIAASTNRSVHTIYNQTRSILAKLGASRAPEAVATARARGLI